MLRAAGCGAMAAVFGTAKLRAYVRGGKAARGRAAPRWLRRSAHRCAVLPNSLRWATPQPFMRHEWLQPSWVAGSPTAGACALLALQPAHAQLCSRAVVHDAGPWCTRRPWRTRRALAHPDGSHRTANAAHGRVAGRVKHRRPRWMVLRPTQVPVHRSAAMGRKTFQRGEFGSSAQRCAERRSHRPATRPCAAYPRGSRAHAPNRVAIAPRPDRARRTREAQSALVSESRSASTRCPAPDGRPSRCTRPARRSRRRSSRFSMRAWMCWAVLRGSSAAGGPSSCPSSVAHR
jgi:hypothetical protein